MALASRNIELEDAIDLRDKNVKAQQINFLKQRKKKKQKDPSYCNNKISSNKHKLNNNSTSSSTAEHKSNQALNSVKQIQVRAS